MTKPKKVVAPDGTEMPDQVSATPPAAPIEGESVDLGDAASRIYQDKAGKSLGGGHSEGKANFGAITAGAIESVRIAAEKDAAE